MEEDFKEKDEVIIMCDIQEMTKLFVVEYYLIWFDPTHLSQTYKEEVEKLKADFNLRISADWKEVKEQIQNKKTTYHLIISGIQDDIILKEIENISNISLAFVFNNNFSASLNISNYPKSKCVETNLKTLILKIEIYLNKWQREDSSLKKDFPAFAPIFDDYDKSKMNYLHYYLQGLTHFRNRTQAKRDFLDLAKKLYNDFNEFDQAYNDYDMAKILKWYTKDSFVYKMTNNCLRIATSDSIQYCRFLLRDLEVAIKEQFQKKSRSFNGVLYRGAFITSQEWDKLKKNVGRDIEMHGFLSTSKAERVAFKFLEADPELKALITIIVPRCSDKEEQGFVDIKEFSDLKGEEEILFNVRSRFTILDTENILFRGKECRHLILLYGKQAWKIDAHCNQKTCKVSVDFMTSRKCALCEKNMEDSQSKLFTTLVSPAQYVCESCLESSQNEYTPLLYIDERKKEILSTQKSIEVSIEGEILITTKDQRVPFYGYKCSECQKKRISLVYYFKCSTCPDGKNLWCSECIKQEKECQQENHNIIVERSGFSFWSEKLSKGEKDFLNYQLEVIQKNDAFQQGETFFKGQEYRKAKQYYERLIEQDSDYQSNKIHIVHYHLGKVYKELGDFNKAIIYFDKAIIIQKHFGQGIDSQTAKSYHELGVVYDSLGDFESSKRYYEKGLEIRRTLYGEQHQEIAESYDGIALVYESLGNFEKAILYYQRGLDMFKAIYGENHPLTAKSYNNLATVYKIQAQNEKAIEYYQKTLDIDKLVLGDYHPDTALVYTSLGSVYCTVVDVNKGLELLGKSIDILKSIYGERSQHIIIPYNNLAATYVNLGKYTQALELHQKTLDLRIDIYGENSPCLYGSYESLGNVYLILQKIDKASECFFKGLNLLKSVYGNEKHPYVASCYLKLALLYKACERERLALEYNEKALEIYKSLFGETHPNIAGCYHNIAIIYLNRFECKKAIDYYLKDIEISKQIFCTRNIELAHTYCSLARAYQMTGEYKKCEEYNNMALSIYDDFYGKDHINTANCYNQLGSCSRNAREYQKALEFHQRALGIYKSCYQDTEDNESIAMTYDLMGSAYKELKDYNLALEYHTKGLAIRRKVYGDVHFKVGESFNNIGEIYQILEDFAKAEDFYKKCLNISQAKYGEDANTSVTYNNLAIIYYRKKKYRKAKEYFEKSLEICIKLRGENHEHTALKYYNLATAQMALGNLKKARDLLLKSSCIKKAILGEHHPDLYEDYYYLSEIFQRLRDKEKAIYFAQLAENMKLREV